MRSVLPGAPKAWKSSITTFPASSFSERSLPLLPGLILADEPTGNLDPETGECIIAHLHELARTTDTAVIVATHNLGFTAAYPGRVIRCEKKFLVDSEPSRL